MYYAIYELPTYAEITQGMTASMRCVADGNDRDVAIGKAEDYFREKAIENYEDGEGEQDAILYIRNDDTGEETQEKITLTWFVDEFEDIREHSTLWGSL